MKKYLEQYYQMLFIRRFEEKIEFEYLKDEMATPIHLYIGEEAIAVGVCGQLNKEDIIISNYRGHGHYIAKGGDIQKLICELYNRENGCSKGRGGSMHIIDISSGIMGTSAIVGGGMPIGVGIAFANKLKGNDNIVVIFHGDGSTEEGVFYESINYSILKDLRVIFVCENNQFACNTHFSQRTKTPSICDRIKGFDIYTKNGDGNDIFEVTSIFNDALNFCKKESKPCFLEFNTMVMRVHVGIGCEKKKQYFLNGDFEICKDKWEEWEKKDPLKKIEKILDENEIIKINTEVCDQINEYFDFAKKSEYPVSQDLLKNVFQE